MSGLGAALLLAGCSGGGDATSEGDTADAGNPWCGRAIWSESLGPRVGQRPGSVLVDCVGDAGRLADVRGG